MLLTGVLQTEKGIVVIMEKGEIRLRKVIVHILDSDVGVPVLSDTLLDCGSDFGDAGAYLQN